MIRVAVRHGKIFHVAGLDADLGEFTDKGIGSPPSIGISQWGRDNRVRQAGVPNHPVTTVLDHVARIDEIDGLPDVHPWCPWRYVWRRTLPAFNNVKPLGLGLSSG